MEHFGFATNIEKRMPQTGKVYYVDRMTSDYAERWPFNVDQFVMEVAQKYDADIERVKQFFNYGLGVKGEKFSTHCPAKGRDKMKKDPKTGIGQPIFGTYPDYVNGCEPALIDAWHKGVEYHTKGFRQGDVLPAILPGCKITRLEDGGWIALFPKDIHLLENGESEETTLASTPAEGTAEAAETGAAEAAPAEATTPTEEAAPAAPKAEPRQLELFMMEAAPAVPSASDEGMTSTMTPNLTPTPSPKARGTRRHHPSKALALEQPVPEPNATKNVLTVLGTMLAMSVLLVILWETGLIIPLGLLGLVISGFFH